MKLIRLLKKTGAIKLNNEEIEEYLRLRQLKKFKSGMEDHIVFFVFSSSDKYHDVLVHFLVKELTNRKKRGFCFVTLTDELGEKANERHVLDTLERYYVTDYKDRLAIFSWDEVAKYGYDGQKYNLRTGRSERLYKFKPSRKCEFLLWIGEDTSKALSYANDPSDFISWEVELKHIFGDELRSTGWPDIPFSWICTYKWEHLLEEKTRGRLDFVSTVTKIHDCHDKTIVLNEKDELLIGRDANNYLLRELAKHKK